jgi:hypothetical protein
MSGVVGMRASLTTTLYLTTFSLLTLPPELLNTRQKKRHSTRSTPFRTRTSEGASSTYARYVCSLPTYSVHPTDNTRTASLSLASKAQPHHAADTTEATADVAAMGEDMAAAGWEAAMGVAEDARFTFPTFVPVHLSTLLLANRVLLAPFQRRLARPQRPLPPSR